MENIRFICVGDDNDVYWIEADSVIYGITSAGNVLGDCGDLLDQPFFVYVDDDNAPEVVIYEVPGEGFTLIVKLGVEPYILFKD